MSGDIDIHHLDKYVCDGFEQVDWEKDAGIPDGPMFSRMNMVVSPGRVSGGGLLKMRVLRIGPDNGRFNLVNLVIFFLLSLTDRYGDIYDVVQDRSAESGYSVRLKPLRAEHFALLLAGVFIAVFLVYIIVSFSAYLLGFSPVD